MFWPRYVSVLCDLRAPIILGLWTRKMERCAPPAHSLGYSLSSYKKYKKYAGIRTRAARVMGSTSSGKAPHEKNMKFLRNMTREIGLNVAKTKVSI